MINLKENQKGITKIKLIVVALVIVIIFSAVLGILSAKNETVENEQVNNLNNNNNIENNNADIGNNNNTEEEEEFPEVIIPVGHEHDYNTVYRETEVTCTRPGRKYLKCECGSIKLEITAESLGHNWNGAEMTKKPTCKEQGELTYKCDKCDETRVEIVKEGRHDFSIQTEKENGEVIYSCSVCGEEQN